MIFSQVKESQRSTGSPTLHMRLPSLCIQALSLRDSTVGANRAGGLSTSRLWLKTSPQERTASPVNRKLLLGLLNHISVISIIQGAALPAIASSPTLFAAKAAPTPVLHSPRLLRALCNLRYRITSSPLLFRKPSFHRDGFSPSWKSTSFHCRPSCCSCRYNIS